VNARDRLIVALDVGSAEEALALVERLAGLAGMFKVGSQLFTAAGPDFVHGLVARGEKVFLDLKYHDIPNTVAGAVSAACRLGVSLVDVHALGGQAMMEAAVGAMPAMGTRLLAITVLTSHDAAELGELGVTGDVTDNVRWPRPRRSRSSARYAARTFSWSRPASGRREQGPAIKPAWPRRPRP